MSDPIVQGLLLFATGLVAGTLNVIAGGGSLLTLPVMIFLGLPPTVANGTNRIAILIQNVGATWSFRKRGLIAADWLRLAIPPALLGALLGTLMAIRIGDLAFQRVLAVILVVVAGWMLWRPMPGDGHGDGAAPTGRRRWLFVAAFFAVGVFGGFIQAGVGFIILAATSAGGLDLVRSNAVKVTIVLLFTPIALAIFAYSGMVNWILGLCLAAGNFLGALMGVHLQVLKGHGWVRKVVTVVIVVFAIRLLLTG